MKRSLALAVLAILIVAPFFWSMRSTTPVPAAPPVVSSAPESVLLATVAVPADATARTEVPVPDPAQSLTTLRGRCVDADGVPIAGVTAELSSRPTTKTRMDAWCAQHAPPEPVAATRFTGADGVFEFRFFPPPPFQFSLGLAKVGHVPERKHWPELEPGTTKDLGDVSMPSGTILRGRVVDTDGVSAVGVTVQFLRLGRVPEVDRARTSDSGYADRDGCFVGRSPLAAGDYGVRVLDRTLVRPAQVTVTGAPIEQVVDVVVAPVGPAVTLSGVVVDDADAPVPLAMITTSPQPSVMFGIVSTDAEGRFRIPRPNTGATAEVALRLDHRDFEVLTTGNFAWGRQDLRLELRRAVEVEVAVVARGVPLGDFAVRIFPRRGGSGSAFDIRARGKGTQVPVVVRGVRRGEYLVAVDPAGEASARSALVPVEVVGPGRTRVTVTLDPVARRTLRVERAGGAPVVGAIVQLGDPMGLPGPLEIRPLEQWGSVSGARALQLQSLATDARGEGLLRGPAGRVLALFLPGPGHAPTWVPDVRLDVGEPLVVTVAAGGRVAGTVGPLELIGEWRLGAGLPVLGPLDESRRHSAPTVVLRRVADGSSEQYPARPVLLDDLGGFQVDDVPVGSWRLVVSWVGFGPGLRQSTEAGVVEVRSGETARIDVDLSALLPGDIEGLVLHNGAVLADALLQLWTIEGKDAAGHGSRRVEPARADALGRFRARVQPGEYRLAAVVGAALFGDGPRILRASGTVVVTRGAKAAQTFHVQSGSVRVRVLDAQGAAVAGVSVELRDAAGTPRQRLSPTGVDGWTTGEVEAEAFDVCVLPPRLPDRKPQQASQRANSGEPDPLPPVSLELASITVRVGETTSVELRLPPD